MSASVEKLTVPEMKALVAAIALADVTWEQDWEGAGTGVRERQALNRAYRKVSRQLSTRSIRDKVFGRASR